MVASNLAVRIAPSIMPMPQGYDGYKTLMLITDLKERTDATVAANNLSKYESEHLQGFIKFLIENYPSSLKRVIKILDNKNKL